MCEKCVKGMGYYITNLKVNKQRWKKSEWKSEEGETYGERQKGLGGESEESRKYNTVFGNRDRNIQVQVRMAGSKREDDMQGFRRLRDKLR